MGSKKEKVIDDSKNKKSKEKTSSKIKKVREKLKKPKKQSDEKIDKKTNKKRLITIRGSKKKKDEQSVIVEKKNDDSIIEKEENLEKTSEPIHQTRVSRNEKRFYILDFNEELDSEIEDDFKKEIILDGEVDSHLEENSNHEETLVEDEVAEEEIEEDKEETLVEEEPVHEVIEEDKEETLVEEEPVLEVIEEEKEETPVEEEVAEEVIEKELIPADEIISIEKKIINQNKSKRKLKLKKGPRIIIFIGIIVFVCLLVLLFLIHNHSSNQYHYSSTKKKIVVQKEEVDYEAKVFMVGDALIHWGVYNDAKQDDGSYDFKPMFQFVKPISSKYDLAYYNQETILGGTSMGLSSYPRFNSPQEVGDAFLDAGFNMVSLATNHTMDKGENGVLKSVEYWKSHPEVAASGQWSSEEERTASIQKVYEVNHIKYAFISYTIWTNGLETPYGKDYLNSVYSDEKAKADIESVRDKVDFVIVAMHWGTEYAFYVDRKQEQIANYLSELGVDLIIGAHPHVVQPVEYINNNKTFVVYSLGNFISDQLDVDNYTGLGMEVTLKKHIGLDGNSINSVVEPKAELFYTVTNQRRGWSSDFRVKTYPSLEDSELRNHASLYEHYKSIVNDRYPDLTWGLTWE